MWQLIFLSLGGNSQMPSSFTILTKRKVGIRFCLGHSIPVFSDIYKSHGDNFLSYSPCKP
ncbi:hypothetical protein HanXRQr2_Chr16g0756731 [Helianthus annuus]|uniref:Uncharacterized protein n=1 Tax=Helianthus annuus TaxID=4232 RepID=A0A251TLA2_HELAN|nr:hypothetical protein HanXRQr2_Chr16g0756731 [Helianthus annuus]KAJ0821869.1 hypothetical protein HanPSC8_Chr16g0725261 [Helianthus annuus]